MFARQTYLTATRSGLLRPYAYSSAVRTFSSSSSRFAAASSHVGHGSTALLENVKSKEEQAGLAGNATTATAKGAEGRHSADGLVPAKAKDSLRDSNLTGNWTLMNPIYTSAELDSVKIVHRDAVSVSDKIAYSMVTILRKTFDFVTGYKHREIPLNAEGKVELTVKELRDGGYILNQDQWLTRMLLLESIAGVPGMVAGVLRHLRSLRLMRRDGGWIHTLLSEAENERMHLLTFMTVKQPSVFFRAVVLGAQGVFFNIFFLVYLFSPTAAHRFVGHLEEEACITYTRCIEEMEKGWVPEWEGAPAPKIAIDYWRLNQDASLLDVIRAVRADEATHRFVNHTLANLDQKRDFNPFALKEPDAHTRGTKFGFTREEAAQFAEEAQIELESLEESHNAVAPTATPKAA